jgi:protoheme IX farnesyltransferase
MKATPFDSANAVALTSGARPSILSDFVTLTKPRVNVLVVMTTLIGLYLGAAGTVDPWLLVHTAVGTALVASGAAALNQVFERETDRLMRRTCFRPLPAGRLGLPEARGFALILSAAGLIELAIGANPLTAAVALATLATYALVYTPLKKVTSLSTVVGAIPGALPPMIGWAAATRSLPIEAWTLFSIVFFWQMPHVLAVSWMYREDYERAGIRVLPVIEPDGASTARQAVAYAAALVPISLLPTLIGLAGGLYFAIALVLGVGLVILSVRFARDRSRVGARRLFMASLLYLPVLWTVLVLNRS